MRGQRESMATTRSGAVSTSSPGAAIDTRATGAPRTTRRASIATTSAAPQATQRRVSARSGARPDGSSAVACHPHTVIAATGSANIPDSLESGAAAVSAAAPSAPRHSRTGVIVAGSLVVRRSMSRTSAIVSTTTSSSELFATLATAST